MKRLLLALLSSFALAASSIAADAPNLSVSVTPAYVTDYMFRGQLISGAAIQPTVEADYGSYVLGVWGSVPFKRVDGQPEHDLYGSYSRSVTDALSIQPGFTLYSYSNVPSGSYAVTFEPSLAVVYTWHDITFTPKLYYDVVLRGPTGEFTTAYVVPLKPLHTEVDLLGVVGAYKLSDASPRVRSTGNYWLAGATLPFAITKTSKVSVGWAYTKGRDTLQDVEGKTFSDAARGVLTVSCSISF